MEISVVNKKTHRPTEYDYYIGRPSTLGNPFTHLTTSTTKNIIIVKSRKEAIDKYNKYFYEKIEDNDMFFMAELEQIEKIGEKHGKVNLVCWCAPKLCHGNVIKEYLINKNRKLI